MPSRIDAARSSTSGLRYGEQTSPARRCSARPRRAGSRPRTGRRGGRRRRAPRSTPGPAALARADRPQQLGEPANDPWNAAQCSRSRAWRARSAKRAARRPTRRRHRLAPRLEVVHPAAEQQRQRGPHQQVVEAAGGVLVHPVPLLVVEHRARALLQHARRHASRPRRFACRRRLGSSSSACRPVSRSALQANSRSTPRRRPPPLRVQHSSVLVRRRAEVAEVLVDPVRHQRRRRCARSTSSRWRISSSHAWEMFQSSWTSWSSKIIAVETVDSSQRIAGLAPALAVELRVLLEVEHALAGRLGGVAPRPMNERVPRRHLVGVDLVAEQQQHVRQLLARLRPACGSASVRSASISRPRGSSSLRQRVRRLVRRRHAAGPEHDLERRPPSARCGTARREADRARGQTRSPSSMHLVLVPGAGLEVAAADERVVVPRTRRRCARRVPSISTSHGASVSTQSTASRLADVAQQRAEDRARAMVGTVPRGSRFGAWSRSCMEVGRSIHAAFPGAGPPPAARARRSGRWSWPRRTRSCARRCSASST